MGRRYHRRLTVATFVQRMAASLRSMHMLGRPCHASSQGSFTFTFTSKASLTTVPSAHGLVFPYTSQKQQRGAALCIHIPAE